MEESVYNSHEELEEDVDEFLAEMQAKYSPGRKKVAKSDTNDLLSVLSEEFESLGFPMLDLDQPVAELLKEVAETSRLLVHRHRKTLAEMKNVNIEGRNKDCKYQDLEKLVDDMKINQQKSKEKNATLTNKMCKLNNELTDLKKVVLHHNEETEKLKRYSKSKETALIHLMNNLKNDNERLKEMCGEEVGKYYSKDDKFTKVLAKYKQNEEKYKGTIQKLEDNNNEFASQILNLKEELATAYSSK